MRFTPDVDKGEVEVLVEINEPSPNVTAEVVVGGGPVWQPGVAGATVATGKAARLKIPKPRLWSPDDPYLYSVSVHLVRDHPGPMMREHGETVSTYFAMRKISAAKDDKGVLRLMLNNKPLFQIGPLDQGWWPDGLLTPPSDAAMKYDLEVLKKLGMNMLRKHIKVEPARLYYHCDALGLLVWQDMPSGGMPATPTVHHSEREGRRLVHRGGEEAIPRRAEGDDRPPSLLPVHRLLGALQRGMGPARYERHPQMGEGVRPVAARRTARAAGPTASMAT